jgi:hypothetical protein
MYIGIIIVFSITALSNSFMENFHHQLFLKRCPKSYRLLLLGSVTYAQYLPSIFLGVGRGIPGLNFIFSEFYTWWKSGLRRCWRTLL